MKEPGLIDGRKIPDDVMEHLRRRAVHAIREKGHSPELVAEVFGFSRSSVYEWLVRYDQGGYEALASRPAPGAGRRGGDHRGDGGLAQDDGVDLHPG